MLAHRIVTLTLNPALDVSAETAKVMPIHKLRCNVPRRDPGGGGINAARVIRRLGGDVACVFPVGGITGRLLEQLLVREGLHGIAVPAAAETREDFTVLEAATGDQYRFVMPGAPLSPDELGQCLDALDRAEADIVVASGSLPAGVPQDCYAEIARRAKAKRRKLIADTSGEALRAALNQGVWLVKPNLRELRELSGLPLETAAEQVAAARAVVTQGGAEIVALSLGDQGAMLVTADAAWAAHSPPITPLSAVGAGDSFVGGLTWALAREVTLREALRHAVAAGTAALLSHGTELCHAEAVLDLLPKVTVDTL